MDRKRYLKDYLKSYRAEVKHLNLTVPKDDYARIIKAASAEGKRPGRLIVEVAIAHIDNAVFVPASVLSELQTLRFLIRNIANNLNQIAHHTNTVKRPADPIAINNELRRLEEVIAGYAAGRLKDRPKPKPWDLERAHDHQIYEP